MQYSSEFVSSDPVTFFLPTFKFQACACGFQLNGIFKVLNFVLNENDNIFSYPDYLSCIYTFITCHNCKNDTTQRHLTTKQHIV